MAGKIASGPTQSSTEPFRSTGTGMAPDVFKSDSGPLIIAGPCSAETEAQVLATACQLSEIGRIDIFRAGLWKPRTRPNSFEGVGQQGLPWLKKAKALTHLKTATEAANAHHIEHCLEQGIDFIWIGARTTVNPFLIEDIAEALRGADVPVLVKNPINPQIDLWIGAIERLYRKGVRQIAAVHRGFSHSAPGKLRYDPAWMIPIELKRHLPHIPLICDPSHMAGQRELIKPLAQMALDFGMEGLMIESHVHPAQAFSDTAQQLEPVQLKRLLSDLVVRRPGTQGHGIDQALDTLRNQINLTDTQIINALSKRMGLVREIGHLKRTHNIPVFQLERWDALQNERISQGCRAGLEDYFIKGLFDLIHAHSVEAQF